MFKIILTIGGIQAVAIFIQLVKSKIVAVFLGPEGVGVVSTIDQTVQFAAYLSALSVPLAAVKFLSKAHSEGHESFQRSYAGFLKLLIFLSIVGTVLALGAVSLKADLAGADLAQYQLFLMLALLTLPTVVLGGFFSNVFASAQEYRSSSFLAVINNAMTGVAIVIGVMTAGVLGLYIGNVVASATLTLGTIIYLWKRFDLPIFDRHTKILEEMRRNPSIVSFAIMLYFGSVTYSLSFLVARYAVLKNFGATEAGLLQGAIALSLALGMVLNPANGLYLTPIMNRNLAAAEKIHHALEFQKKMLLILSLAAIPMVLFPQLMLAILFSTKFASVSNLVFLFVIAQFISQLAGVHQALLIGTDDLKFYTVIVTGGQLAFALLAWLLVPYFGIKGVAYGQIISGTLIFGLSFIRLNLKHKFYLPRNLSLLLGYSLFAVIVTGLLSNEIAELNALVVLSKVVFFVLFGSSLFFFLNKDEKESLYGLRHRLLFGR